MGFLPVYMSVSVLLYRDTNWTLTKSREKKLIKNSSFWLIDGTLTGTTTRNQRKGGSNGNKVVLHIPQSSGTKASPSDNFVLYPWYLQRCSRCSLRPQPTRLPVERASEFSEFTVRVFVYLYLYMWICVYVCESVYVWERERERVCVYVCVCERERERENVCVCMCDWVCER